MVPPRDRDDRSPSRVALPTTEPSFQVKQQFMGLHACCGENRRREQLRMPADAFYLDEIARPEILEPGFEESFH